MLVSTEGLVLKQIPYSESSLICKVYTRDYGLLSFLIKGARSAKSKQSKSSIVRPLNFLSFSFYHRETKNLKSFKEISLLFAPDAMNFGIYKSAVAMMMVEVLSHTIQEESHPDPVKYNFIQESFDYLRYHSLQNHFYLSFLYQYAHILGFGMETMTNPEIIERIEVYNDLPLLLPKNDRKKIFHTMEQEYISHIPTFKSLKSIGILEEILQ